MIALLVTLTLGQAITAYEEGRLGEAQAALAAIVAEQPRNAEALTWLGAAQLENGGDAVGAEKTLREAVKLAPRSARAHMLLGVAIAQQIEDAFVFRKLSLASEVHKEFERALKLAPRSIPAHEAMLEYDRHAPAIAGGGDDAARAEIEQLDRLDHFAGLLGKARLDGDFRAAAREARDGEQLAAIARASRRLEDFRAAVQARPADARLRAELGEAQLTAGDAAGAAVSFRAAATLDPALAWTYWGLGRALERLGQRAEARKACLRFAELAPTHHDAEAARKRAAFIEEHAADQAPQPHPR